MSKEIHMTAGEFREWQDFLGLDHAEMADALRRRRRSVDNYRRDGITDQLVAERVLFLVAEKQARINHEDCIMKCGAKAEDNSPYCAACSAEARSEWQ